VWPACASVLLGCQGMRSIHQLAEVCVSRLVVENGQIRKPESPVVHFRRRCTLGCKQFKRVLGGNNSKAGFRCAECVAKRQEYHNAEQRKAS
jgi:hypothetical protein